MIGPWSRDKALAETAREVAIRAAREAGKLLKRHLGKVRHIQYKGETHLVTEADILSEKTIVDIIRRHFPDHQVLAEEGSVGGDNPDFRWIVDPLDGTTNYAHGLPIFAVSIGLEAYGQMVLGVVHDPNQGELFVAEKDGGVTLNGRRIRVSTTSRLAPALLATGFPYDRSLLPESVRQFEVLSYRCLAVRRLGSAALALCYVAAGRCDAYWETAVSAWDVAAGWLLVQEAGGTVTDLRGGPFRLDTRPILASNGHLHEAMIEALREA